MTEYRFESRSRFEGTLGAQALPVVGADRRRDRQRSTRLLVAGTCLFVIGILALSLSGCARTAGEKAAAACQRKAPSWQAGECVRDGQRGDA